MKDLKKTIQAAFLDYFNNYITTSRFAEDYGLTIPQARTFIELGRSIHESIVAENKKESS